MKPLGKNNLQKSIQMHFGIGWDCQLEYKIVTVSNNSGGVELVNAGVDNMGVTAAHSDIIN